MIKNILIKSIFVLLMFGNITSGIACDKSVDFIDFQSKYLVRNIELKDSYSDEYVRRSFFLYDDGDFFVVEQKKCTMSNYTMNYYFSSQKGGNNYQVIVKRYLDVADDIFSQENIEVKNNFKVHLIESLKQHQFNQNNFQLKKKKNDENIEYNFSLSRDESSPPMYENKFVTYIGIGGL